MTPTQFKAARLALGMTQKQMAEWLYTNDRRIRAWERGEAAIPGGVRRCLEMQTNTITWTLDENGYIPQLPSKKSLIEFIGD